MDRVNIPAKFEVCSWHCLSWQCLSDNACLDIVITKPRSDICWECHQNNTAIYRSANLPDAVKGAKLRKQEEHLRTVTNERQAYQQMVAESKIHVADCRLGRNDPRSRDTAVHYSFDYAQHSKSIIPVIHCSLGQCIFYVRANVAYLAFVVKLCLSRLTFWLIKLTVVVKEQTVWSVIWITSLLITV